MLYNIPYNDNYRYVKYEFIFNNVLIVQIIEQQFSDKYCGWRGDDN